MSLKGPGQGMDEDGDSFGYDVLKVDFIEVDSFAETAWVRTTILQIRVYRSWARFAVSCDIGCHLENDVCGYVCRLKGERKLETAESERRRIEELEGSFKS